MTDIDLYSDKYEFVIDSDVLIIKLIKERKIIGRINLYLDDNDLMGLLNLIKDYFDSGKKIITLEAFEWFVLGLKSALKNKLVYFGSDKAKELFDEVRV